jgi:hypothetical protein
MILDGPVTANDYDWYQVAAWDPKDPQATFPAGWVARGDHDGTPWISEAADVCPTGEVTIADVVGLAPAERVACFGHRELRLRAFVTDGSESYACTADPGCTNDGPSWLTGLGGSTAEVDAQSAAAGNGPILAIDPDGAVRDRLDAVPGPWRSSSGRSMTRLPSSVTRSLAPPRARRRISPRVSSAVRGSSFATSRADPTYPRLGAAITATDRLRVRSTPGSTAPGMSSSRRARPSGSSMARRRRRLRVVPGHRPGLEVDGVPRVGWVAPVGPRR